MVKATQNHRTAFASEYQDAFGWMLELGSSIEWLEHLDEATLVEVAKIVQEAAASNEGDQEQQFERFKESLRSNPDTLETIVERVRCSWIAPEDEDELLDFIYSAAIEEQIDVNLIEDFVATKTREELIEIMLDLKFDSDREIAIQDMIPGLSGNHTHHYFTIFEKSTRLGLEDLYPEAFCDI